MKENIRIDTINSLLPDRDIRGDSSNWANWESVLTLTTCKECADNRGKIVDIYVLGNGDVVNAHPRCRCIYVPMRTKAVGTATDMGVNGADEYVFRSNKLPSYYVNKKQAVRAGWKEWKGNLNEILPGRMIGGDVFRNNEGKLPYNDGRIWYEADINYENGYRNGQRLLYSSDGLIFATYDHYHTFYEITK